MFRSYMHPKWQKSVFCDSDVLKNVLKFQICFCPENKISCAQACMWQVLLHGFEMGLCEELYAVAFSNLLVFEWLTACTEWLRSIKQLLVCHLLPNSRLCPPTRCALQACTDVRWWNYCNQNVWIFSQQSCYFALTQSITFHNFCTLLVLQVLGCI